MTPLQYAAQICYSTNETLRFSYDMAVKYKDFPGVYVECGVAAGAQVIAMATGAPNKTIYAFDSFEGIPMPSNKDNQMPGIKFLTQWEQRSLPDPGRQALVSSGATIVPEDHFWQHIKDSGVNGSNIITVKGWFEETVKGFNEDIAILRLDGDLYNSTFVCLQHIFPKVIEGGLVIIDDWELKGCQEACKEYFGLISYEPEYQSMSNIKFFVK